MINEGVLDHSQQLIFEAYYKLSKVQIHVTND
jgi:hypothetical protein